MEPEITKTNPQAYYYWLRQQGLGIQEAGALVSNRFGAPKTPEEKAKQAAKDQQTNALAGTAGTVAGVYAASKVPGLISGLSGSGSGAVATPQVISVTRAGDVANAAQATNTAAAGAKGSTAASGGGGVIGMSPMAGLGAGAVAAYYGPTYAKYAETLASGDVNEDEAVKSLMLTNPMTAWAVPIMDKTGIGIKTGKHKDQLRRDVLRKGLKESGAVGDDYQLNLDTGASFDIGRDGNWKDAKGLRSYELDHTNPDKAFQGDLIGMVNPLVEYLAAGNDKLRSDFTGQFTRGILDNSNDLETAKLHAQALYNKMGVTDRGAAEQMISDLLANKGITEEEAAAYRFGVASLFGNPTGGSATPQQPTRAASGQVARVSPGMYVDDQGAVRKANDLRSALKQAYKNTRNRRPEL